MSWPQTEIRNVAPGRSRYQWQAIIAAFVLPFHAVFPAPEPRESKSNAESRRILRVAVLPFQNASSDAALDDWQQVLPGLVRSLLKETTLLTVQSSKVIQPVWIESGGRTNTNRVEFARQVAADLNSDAIVWGEFVSRTNTHLANVSILTTNLSAAPHQIQITATNWVGLAERITVQLANHLGRPSIERELRYWLSQMPESDAASAPLARAIALSILEGPKADQEKALRELLDAERRCAFAYSSLLKILAEQKQTNELNKVSSDFLRVRPDICDAHLAVAHTHFVEGENEAAERLQREALRLHPGCPGAIRGLFFFSAQRGEPGDMRGLLEEAHRARPGDIQTKILLAMTRSFEGDVRGARELLDFHELPPEDLLLDDVLLKAAMWTSSMELLGLELLRLGPRAVTNEPLREMIGEIAMTNRVGTSPSNPRITFPRRFTAAELEAELARRLSPEERPLVVNPLEVTPDLIAEARRLTTGLPNDDTKIIALFSEVARRGRGRREGSRHTAHEALKASRNSQNQFLCQEFAKLFVGLARAAGLDAWLVHIDRDAFGYPGYHDCAAVSVEGEIALIDPTWRMMGFRHQEFAVLDDLQAISHHMMQPADSGPDPGRLRAGLKLNPEDRWTRVQFVRQMAQANELAAAAEELRKLQRGSNTWDVHVAAATIHMHQERSKLALDELQKALTLSPSNAMVHLELADIYTDLKNPDKSEEHLNMAFALNRGEITEETRQQAPFKLAVLRAIGQGQSENRPTREALQRRAEAGDLAAQMGLAKACFEAQPRQIEEGMRWLRKAAEQGDDQAQLNYGNNLLALKGVDGGKEAVEWWTRSAEQGNRDAQYRLGLALYDKQLVPQDRIAASKWVYLAAGKGHKPAKSLLGELEIFFSSSELAAGREQAMAFKPVNQATSPKRVLRTE